MACTMVRNDPAACCNNQNWECADHERNQIISEDNEVDIVGMTGDKPCVAVKLEGPDDTECSSSFGDTLSGSVADAKLELSDFEVDSPFRSSTDYVASATADVADSSDHTFRKRKVTEHWRKYVSPLVWRCRWLELKMNELRSQAIKYDSELSVIGNEKVLHLKMIELDCSSSRTLPFYSQSMQRKPMKRRKRNRKEDAVDTASYISNHIVFSYYDNNKTVKYDHSLGDDNSDKDEKTKMENDVDFLLETKKSDPAVEQILQTIEFLQGRVVKLRSLLKTATKTKGTFDVAKLHKENADSSSCSDEKNGDDSCSESRTISDLDMEDMCLPDSAISSFGDAADLDVYESTLGLVSHGRSHRLKDIPKQGFEDMLIDNYLVEAQCQNFETAAYPREQPNGLVKEEVSSHSEGESCIPSIVIRDLPHGNGMEVEPLEFAKPAPRGRRRGRPRKRRQNAAGALYAARKNGALERKRCFSRA